MAQKVWPGLTRSSIHSSRPKLTFLASRHTSIRFASRIDGGDITGGPVAFDLQGLTTNRSAARNVAPTNPAWGTAFTDHMLSVQWTANNGWEAPRIHPLEHLRIHPATSCLQYAFQCFEGLKAYRDVTGRLRLFRPDMNMNRLNQSAARIALPTFDTASAVQLLARFVAFEEQFVPSGRGQALYLRPTFISTEPTIAMAPPSSALLYIIACPVASFYASGQKAVSLEATSDYVRAWPGGSGDTKIGANYGPCFLPQVAAASRGYQQNLWLFGEEKYLGEVGTMNVFVVITDPKSGKHELITPPLDGTILPGVTRDSVLHLARTRLPADEYFVSERRITMTELAHAAHEGRLRETFGTGTAVVVSPVRTIGWEGRQLSCGLPKDAEAGPVASLMKNWIEDIQYGKEPHEWSFVIQ